jgi:hypothetical protein
MLERSRSRTVVSQNTLRADRVEDEDGFEDSRVTWDVVSRTSRIDITRPAMTNRMPIRKGTGRNPNAAASHAVANAATATER